MSNEATVNSSLAIRKGYLNYQSQPTTFKAAVAGTKGPTPGAVTVATSGTNISFGELVQPSLCRLQNLDASNLVEWGIHDGAVFHPVGELLPGESFVIRLSRNLLEREDIPGTGTTGDVTAFCLRAVGASCVCLVEAFEA